MNELCNIIIYKNKSIINYDSQSLHNFITFNIYKKVKQSNYGGDHSSYEYRIKNI
jgi:hypothetical protein